MERGPGPRLARAFAQLSAYESRDRGRRRVGSIRSLDQRSTVRRGMAANGSRSRLGALSCRAVGMGRLLWLDLGERGSLGMGSVSLWPMVLRVGRMVLVSRTGLRAALLGACASGLFRLWGIRRI